MTPDNRNLTGRRTAALAALTVAVAGITPAVAHAAKPTDPEQKRFPPSAHAGYFIGTPYPTHSWHGCTATAAQQTLAAMQHPIPGLRPNTTGAKQSAVTFTRTVGAPYLSWKAKKGWAICGVQAMAELTSPDVDHGLAAEIGYPSGVQSGSLSADGRETLAVPVPRRAKDFYRDSTIDPFMGKTLSIQAIRDVTVFVRRVR
jgi:hypothetical protein